MTTLVLYLLVFVAIGAFFLFFHLLLGKVVRPARPAGEKLTIYECGEPTIGSAWVQFDLRYYVVALLFVIFDVEVAFFFPWAVVFGKATRLAEPQLTAAERKQLTQNLAPDFLFAGRVGSATLAQKPTPAQETTAWHQLARTALVDLLIFFGVLLVGFAYLWRRGDLDWVRSVRAEQVPVPGGLPTRVAPEEEPQPVPATVGAASSS